MIRGHHTPHCFSWYRNGVEFAATSPEYREALERRATSEIENLGYASAYADGRDCGAKGVIWANWNAFPRGLETILERMGYSLEWSDCVSTCDGCYKAIQTEPDCYSWTPQYTIGDGYITCAACLEEDPETYVQELLNDPHKADTLGVNLKALGFEQYNGTFENGFHPGQNDRPNEIVKRLPAGVEYVFQIADKGQFDIRFTCWIRPEGYEAD